MDDVKESVRQGVTKVAGRLSGMASGVMSSIQVRLGVKHQNLVTITNSAYFRESNMPTSPWVFVGTCLVSILCLYGRELAQCMKIITDFLVSIEVIRQMNNAGSNSFNFISG